MVSKRQLTKWTRDREKRIKDGDPDTLREVQQDIILNNFSNGIIDTYTCLRCGYTTQNQDTDHCCCRECHT